VRKSPSIFAASKATGAASASRPVEPELGLRLVGFGGVPRMTLKVSRRGGISPFIVMEVMRAAHARAAAGGDVIHLEVGQPSTGAPAAVIATAQGALARERLGYTEALGLPGLRARIARHYRETYGVEVGADRIVVTTGSSGAFLLAFLAAFDADDHVALADPGYPAYRNILGAVDVTPVGLPSDLDDGFQPTPALLAAAQSRRPLDGVIVASPANPTGSMMAPLALRAVVDWCRANGARLISDEIYHGIAFGSRAETALAFDETAIVINSFSKYFSMTGWRLGWMVVPKDLARAVECLAQNLFISPPTLAQFAAVAAFDAHEELQANVARYARNREILMAGLAAAGVDRLAPADGAFYLYADVSGVTADSAEFCARMLAETGIAATPGIDFDPLRGARFVRFCFAGSEDEMREASGRLKAWLNP
jgi:aspartate/methionine/tyrosine aminotransferase